MIRTFQRPPVLQEAFKLIKQVERCKEAIFYFETFDLAEKVLDIFIRNYEGNVVWFLTKSEVELLGYEIAIYDQDNKRFEFWLEVNDAICEVLENAQRGNNFTSYDFSKIKVAEATLKLLRREGSYVGVIIKWKLDGDWVRYKIIKLC